MVTKKWWQCRKEWMSLSTHGMVTIVATQSRPAMMRRVRERLGRLEKGWMIVRYLIENNCLISEKGRMISKYNNVNGYSGSTIVAKVHAVSMTTYRPVKCNGSQRERGKVDWGSLDTTLSYWYWYCIWFFLKSSHKNLPFTQIWLNCGLLVLGLMWGFLFYWL